MGRNSMGAPRLHRLILWGSVGVMLTGTGVVGAGAAVNGGPAKPAAQQWFTPLPAGKTFLPTSGPQRSVILGPDHRVYAMPKNVPPAPTPSFLQQVPGGACTAE